MGHRFVSRCAAVTLAAGLMCSLSGCIGLAVIGAQRLAQPSEDEEELLAQTIVDGATTKSELVDKLGAPLHELNEGSVLIFGGRSRPRGLVQLLKEDKGDDHRLIAVFDRAGVMRDHLWVGRKKAGRKAAFDALGRTD